nr:uncharacterized protein LOC127338287 [Lolium perenne]
MPLFFISDFLGCVVHGMHTASSPLANCPAAAKLEQLVVDSATVLRAIIHRRASLPSSSPPPLLHLQRGKARFYWTKQGKNCRARMKGQYWVKRISGTRMLTTWTVKEKWRCDITMGGANPPESLSKQPACCLPMNILDQLLSLQESILTDTLKKNKAIMLCTNSER